MRGQDGLYYAHPFINLTDFSSRGLKFTYDVQRCVPLAGIFFLRQGKLDLLEPIGKAEASVHLDKSSWDVFIRYKNHIGPLRQHRKMQLDSACGLAKSIPGFVLFATLDGRFWDEMGKALLFAEERR